MVKSRRPILSHYNRQTLWVLMGLSVLVYVAWQIGFRNQNEPFLSFMSQHFLVSTEAIRSGRVWTVLTSEFSHIEPRHLLFNMIGLWVFGNAVHQVIRDALFIKLYVVSAILASVAHVVFGLFTGDPTGALGASGAVMGIAVVYALLFPNRTLLLFFVIPCPAWLAVILFLGIDLLGVVGTIQDRTAHMAHLGGAAYGLGFYWFWLRTRLRKIPRQ